MLALSTQSILGVVHPYCVATLSECRTIRSPDNLVRVRGRVCMHVQISNNAQTSCHLHQKCVVARERPECDVSERLLKPEYLQCLFLCDRPMAAEREIEACLIYIMHYKKMVYGCGERGGGCRRENQTEKPNEEEEEIVVLSTTKRGLSSTTDV